MFKSGMYTNAPVPTQFLSISKKAAYGAKQAMEQGWKFDKTGQVSGALRFATSKVSRGQLGEGIHQVWIKDLVRVGNTKIFFICTSAFGPVEVEAARLLCLRSLPTSCTFSECLEVRC